MKLFLIIITLSTSLFSQIFVTSGELGIEITKLKNGVKVSSIRKNNLELLNKNATSELFTLTIKNSFVKTPLILNSSKGWDNVTLLSNGSNCNISFETPTDKDFSQSLKVVVTITTDDKKAEWNISVTGLGKSSLHEVIFPQFNIKTDENDYFFLPHYFGQEISCPKSSAINSTLLYPTGWDVSMQFSAYYNDNYGVYLGTHDPKASVKYSTTKIKDDGIVYYNKIPIPNKSINNNNWEMPGVFCLELFNGNWYDASQIYKKWVSSEATFFSKRDATRNKRQEQLGNIKCVGLRIFNSHGIYEAD